VAQRLERLREEHDGFRSVVVNEPRGSDALVGALLGPPSSASAVAQVIFFNNVGYLGMCVHGAIGVARTLAHLGRVGAGRHVLETPAGDVAFTLGEEDDIAVENVVSRRHAKGVEVSTDRHGVLKGDIAYGGNWFYLVEAREIDLSLANARALTELASDALDSLARHAIAGAEGRPIDHIELFGPPRDPRADSRNFVLCPGRAYDRSPCGTGTSAKMACLAADGRLEAGQTWHQESIIGSRFLGSIEPAEGGVRPTIRGRAFITGEATLLVDPRDPFRDGIQG
jgi:4-hydroxyproline epimerase